MMGKRALWLVALLWLVGCEADKKVDPTEVRRGPLDVAADFAVPDGGREQAAEDGVPDLPTDETAGPLTCQPGIQLREIPTAADTTFDLGPYVMDTRPDSAVIMWRSVDEAVGTVHFGTGEEPDQSVSESEAVTVHEIRVEGLAPATRYAYRVESSGKSSQVHHFHTAPAGPVPFRAIVWGDNQNGPEVLTQLLDQMVAAGPHIAVGVGDHVQTGSEEALWKSQLFDPARALFHEVPFYAAIGNHEGNAKLYYQLFSHPVVSQPPDTDNESYYSYTYGNAFFLVLNVYNTFFLFDEEQSPVTAWVREQIESPEAQAATWRIVYAHEPMVTESWSPESCTYDGNSGMRDYLVPLLQENHFQLYLSGHAHVYERGMLDGIAHVITGGGGGHLDEWCVDLPETEVVAQRHHFLTLDAECDTLRVEARDLEGTVFDWFELATDQPGVFVDEGPIDGLPDLVVNSASPTRGAR